MSYCSKLMLVGLCAVLGTSQAQAAGYGIIIPERTGLFIMAEMAKRVAPKPVTPLTLNGVRYEAPTKSGAGILEAYDAAMNALLWTLPVCKIDFDANEEKDVQEVYIQTIVANEDSTGLIVTDERGRVWAVDVAARTSVRIHGTSADDEMPTLSPAQDRLAPEFVAPVDYRGVRYDVDVDDGGGVVRATNIATLKPLWVVTVYQTDFDTNLEKDVQEVYITSLDIDKSRGRLLVSDERKRTWAVDLETQEVILLAEDQ